ncbi:MAG TPA: phosphoadenosine phosphosulfate reductase family protein [Candidatus Bathyarchaeia archaeon]|nr:phosphoadenosine phosphosulfate reductase family protein [Candidatus Bathyarchaeia archaeon]
MPRRKTIPYLGSIKLHWCDICNLPILDCKYCGFCHQQTRSVPISPPGDVRPAFKKDILRIGKIIDDQFGSGSANDLGLNVDNIVLLNEISYDDLMDEIIIDGFIVGAIRYNLFLKQWDFQPRILGAKRIFEGTDRRNKSMTIDPGANEYIINGYNVLAPGIIEIDKSLKKGEGAVALSLDGKVLSCGTMRINASELDQIDKGVVLKPKHFLKKFTEEAAIKIQRKPQTWSAVIEANKETIERYEARSIESIISIKERYSEFPLSVSFSGGKDSLVCLQLVRKIPDLNYKILFVNTSLEFPETITYVDDFIEKNNLKSKFCKMDIPKERFWEAVENYGPPGKDYRYCCKILKIGPINDLIEDCIGKRTLSLIGQRGYESIARSESRTLWSNPWIPNQLNYTPIQKWTALHVWLYIFKEQLYYNPMYEEGYSRIGCWLCPACNQGTFELIKETHKPLWDKWEDFLKKWQEKNELPPEWLSWGLWRWRKLPKKMLDLAADQGVSLEYEKREKQTIGDWSLTFTLVEGFATCKTGEILLEGSFNKPINLKRLSQFWAIFSEIDFDEELGILSAKGSNATATLSADGAVVAKGKTLAKTKNLFKNLVYEVFRSEECNGCTVCLTHCSNDAIYINEEINQVEIRIDNCIQCKKCHQRCPIMKFGHNEIEELFSKENNS